MAAACAFWAARPQRLMPGIAGEFAVLGALHATALALCIPRTAGFSPGRAALLVAGGALLAWCTVRLGFRSMALVQGLGLHGAGIPFLVLAMAAGLGAAAYGMLLRSLVRDGPSLAALAVIAPACAAAACASLALCRRAQLADPLWLALPWWLAFSGGLSRCAHPARSPLRCPE